MDTNIIFGTDGIRGDANSFPFKSHSLILLGQAIALWVKKKYKCSNPHFIIASDTRISSPRIIHYLTKGIKQENAYCYRVGIAPTPSLVCLLEYHKAHAAIMVSASHNPYSDNGIKIFDIQDGKITVNDEQCIAEYFNVLAHTVSSSFSPISLNFYKNFLLSHSTIRNLNHKKVVIDCAHGALYKIAPELFQKLGAHVIAINNKPNGKNINNECGSVFPHALQKKVIGEKADIGFAFDGDGDRVIAVNRQGLIKNGDDILALLINNSLYKHSNAVVGTIMSNYGLEHYLSTKNIALIRTDVGDRNIVNALKKYNLNLGGEASGHIIIRPYMATGDGLFTALKILETIEETGNDDFLTFKKYPYYVLNIPVVKKENLTHNPYAPLIEHYKQQISRGRMIIRFSGTENVLRIMIEDETLENAKKVAIGVAKELQLLLHKNSL